MNNLANYPVWDVRYNGRGLPPRSKLVMSVSVSYYDTNIKGLQNLQIGFVMAFRGSDAGSI